jgi:fimbrial chaperone protein
MSENTLKVGLTNKGNAHVQVTDFSLFVPGDDKAIASESGSSYIMAGQKREWLLKSTHLKKVANGRLHLKAYTDAGDIDTDLVLGKP